MSSLVKRLSSYGDYHRDGHNIATHMVGIPLIVFAVDVLLSRPMLTIGQDMIATPAMLLSAIASLFYFRLDMRFGIVMAALLALAAWAGLSCARMSTVWWLTVGFGSFVAGWALQFLGHHFEGRKPAFVDDVAGLIVGPLFIVAEVAFLMGFRPEVKEAIHDVASHRV